MYPWEAMCGMNLFLYNAMYQRQRRICEPDSCDIRYLNYRRPIREEDYIAWTKCWLHDLRGAYVYRHCCISDTAKGVPCGEKKKETEDRRSERVEGFAKKAHIVVRISQTCSTILSSPAEESILVPGQRLELEARRLHFNLVWSARLSCAVQQVYRYFQRHQLR